MSENTLINQLPNNLPEGLSLEGLGVPAMGSVGPDFQGTLKVQDREFPVAIEVKNAGGTATFREAARQIKAYSSQGEAIPFVAGQFLEKKLDKLLKKKVLGSWT